DSEIPGLDWLTFVYYIKKLCCMLQQKLPHSESVKVKQCIFFYDDEILRNRRDRYFKEMKGNRSIHAVVSTDDGCSLSSKGDVSMTLQAIKHLATKDAIVAIASADRGEEYYLLQVIGDAPEVLSTQERDDWGATYPPGAEIIHRYFLARKRSSSSHYYELVREKEAAVYAATVRYICHKLC
ncbi:Hypothetical predicted protein, partial [Paramuricea clavata]